MWSSLFKEITKIMRLKNAANLSTTKENTRRNRLRKKLRKNKLKNKNWSSPNKTENTISLTFPLALTMALANSKRFPRKTIKEARVIKKEQSNALQTKRIMSLTLTTTIKATMLMMSLTSQTMETQNQCKGSPSRQFLLRITSRNWMTSWEETLANLVRLHLRKTLWTSSLKTKSNSM